MSPIQLMVMLAALHAADTVRSIDACALLTNADLESILGETIKDRKPGTQVAGALTTSQCFFASASARSVSLTVTRTNPAGRSGVTAREYWRRQFHAGEHDAEDDRRARPVPGLGDEAFWTGTRFAGALYVLRGDVFVRISVGGIGDEKARIDASKRLAREVLRRVKNPELGNDLTNSKSQIRFDGPFARPRRIEIERHPPVVLTFA
jgi:hypothetical protein